MNFGFKAALIERFGSQIGAARATGLSEWRVSRIVQGWDEPRENEMELLGKALGNKRLRKLLRQKSI